MSQGLCGGCGNADYNHRRDNGICIVCKRPMFGPYHVKFEELQPCVDCGESTPYGFVVLRPFKTTQRNVPFCSKHMPSSDPIEPWLRDIDGKKLDIPQNWKQINLFEVGAA